MGLRFGAVVSALSVAACAIYLTHTLHTFYNLYNPEVCVPGGPVTCIFPYLTPQGPEKKLPPVSIRIFVAEFSHGGGNKIELYRNDDLKPDEDLEVVVPLKLPISTRHNGSLFAHVILLPVDEHGSGEHASERQIARLFPLTQYQEPIAETFQLIAGEETAKEQSKVAKKRQRPVTHIKSKIYFSIVADDIIFPLRRIPPELLVFVEAELGPDQKHYYHPLFYVDSMSSRLADLIEIKPSIESVNVTVIYRPISIGKLRLFQNLEIAFKSLRDLGFSDKDFDEIKSIFTDTNFYFLMLTIFVSTVHLLLDVLSFKNDINFWRHRKTMVGLSSKTLVWRCVSQTIIFFYLKEERTSLLVLLPSGFAVLVEFWKLQKAFKVTWTRTSWGLPWPVAGNNTEAERQTVDIDSQAMWHLSKLLVPLCIAGAIYSLLYVPHKSWYSWIINCLANGVYAFGFLFMLPQLFVNYKLKSVAHLPWRAFTYKAFNTFIDDIFAFIISMPISHRVACFRDDVVFLVYLYQRYLYPVDYSRVNEFGEAFDNVAADADKKQVPATTTAAETKKTK